MLEDLKVKKKVKTCCGKHCLEGRFNRCFGRKCTACVDADQADLDDDLSTEKRAQADEVEMMTIRVNVYDRKDRLDDLVRPSAHYILGVFVYLLDSLIRSKFAGASYGAGR